MTEKLTGLDFFESQRIAVGTDRRIRYDGGSWLELTDDSEGEQKFKTQAWLWEEDAENAWWPSFGQQKEKVWEVEPEKPKEIIVWCWCDEDGISRLYDQEPLSLGGQGFRAAGESILELSKGRTAIMQENNLFSKDKLQKYRLIPADQPLWPWEKFDPDEIDRQMEKDDSVSYLVLRAGCFPESARWRYQGGDWYFWRDDGVRLNDVKYYCRVSKIPIPEQK